ncbi:MAG: hypothetical protein M3O46_12080, partial [Myxococcota bacterium]|nr:hypothetical protein [Myxococcota bacterium]
MSSAGFAAGFTFGGGIGPFGDVVGASAGAGAALATSVGGVVLADAAGVGTGRAAGFGRAGRTAGEAPIWATDLALGAADVAVTEGPVVAAGGWIVPDQAAVPLATGKASGIADAVASDGGLAVAVVVDVGATGGGATVVSGGAPPPNSSSRNNAIPARIATAATPTTMNGPDAAFFAAGPGLDARATAGSVRPLLGAGGSMGGRVGSDVRLAGGRDASAARDAAAIAA